MGHRLPEELTSFVGREPELAELDGLLSTRRLVTVTGVGGGGKTRLAMRLAARIGDRWREGAWLADLAPVTDPSLVPQVVASVLEVLVEPGHPSAQQASLAARIRERPLLLCLDTCEHVLDAAADLADTLLRRCPEVTLLATSREPLGVEGETVWRIPSLRPEDAHRLFADRAALADPHFDPGPVEAAIAAVCDRVDRLPLAIELAAAWVRALTPAQIAGGLADSLRLLEGGPRSAVARHQTLLASMAWSHDLLAPDEQVFFRRLGVFAGAFTLAAAREVAFAAPAGGGAPARANGPERGVLSLIGRLLDTSLVTAHQVQGEVRYRMLDTVRQYAGEQLRAAGETEELRDRHLDHFLALAEQAEPGLDTDQDHWRSLLESHRADLNAALRWALSPEPERAVHGRRLAAAIARQWFLRGQAAEGLGLLSRAIELDPEDTSPLHARLLAGTAMLGMISGRTDLAAQAARSGLEITDPSTEQTTGATPAGVARARCLAMAAYPAFFTDFERCQELAAQARSLAEVAGDAFARDWATVMEAYSLQTRNRHEEAAELARLAFTRSHPRGDRFTAAFARGVEIFTTMVSGDVTGATEIGQEAVQIATPLGDYFAVGTNSCNAAHALVLAGRLPEARAMMEPVVRSVDTAAEADVVGFMVPYGLLHLADGDLEGALGWFERGVARMSNTDPDWTAARCLPGLVGTLRRLGRTGDATTWADRAVEVETGFDAIYELTAILDEQGLLARGDPARARDLHLRALALRVAHGLRTGYADSLDALAAVAMDADDPAEATRLASAADTTRQQAGYPRPPVDQPGHQALVASLHASLSDDRFREAWREGAETDLNSLVAGLTRGRGPRDRPQTGWASLTPTEIEVTRLVRDGLSNPQIATRLYMSRSTVKTHLAHAYAKVGVANRAALAALAGTELDDC